MRLDRQYFAEEKVGHLTDTRLMKWLYPFIQPYRRHLVVAVALIFVVTLIDLAVPYVTKMAIDRYIVPVSAPASPPRPGTGNPAAKKDRFIEVDRSDPATLSIVAKYRDRFMIDPHRAVIRLTDLKGLSPADIAVLRKSDLNGIAWLTLIFLVLITMGLAINFAQQMMMETVGQRVMHNLRMRVFGHIQSLSMAFFTKNPVGRLVTRVTNDVQNMHELFTAVIVFIFKDLFLLIGICVVLLLIDWRLAVICFAVFPVVIVAALYFARQARDAYRTLRIKMAEINTRLTEAINGMRVIQLFRQVTASERRFKHLNHENYSAQMRQMHVFAIFMPFVDLLGSIALAVVIYFGGGRYVDNHLSLGVLVAFISYIRMFFRPIRDIAEKYNIIQNAMSSAERLFVVLSSTERMPLPTAKQSDVSSLNRIHQITFDQVTFGYLTATPVLKDIHLTINKGEQVAVVGPTGSGKTTLINLLVRFYDPTQGQVMLNGRPLTEFDISALRRHMAMVTQDPLLFTGTIAENIRFGNPSLSDQALMQVIEKAHCTDLIAKLPGGIDFTLSGGKEALSSGERQLISIARAFARDPQLLILDEATSYIDSVTEQHIQEALTTLMHHRTTLIVAHRLSTARKAHRIVVINHGRIVETGTHVQLIQKQGFYYRLGQLQR